MPDPDIHKIWELRDRLGNVIKLSYSGDDYFLSVRELDAGEASFACPDRHEMREMAHAILAEVGRKQ